MSKRVVYVSTLIKKRRYLPRGVRIDCINEYFSTEKKLGGVVCLSGEWDDTDFFKKPDYNIMII